MEKSHFVHLHTHSHFSHEDGVPSPQELAREASHLGFSALALTDHNTLAGIPSFTEACRQYSIKPIIGCELNILPFQMRIPAIGAAGDKPFHHATLIVRNKQGFFNLIKLVSRAHKNSDDGEPFIAFDDLGESAEGLIFLTGCQRGELYSLLKEARVEDTEEYLRRLIQIFGRNNVFFELTLEDSERERTINGRMVQLAEFLGAGIVATNNVHYILPEDEPVYMCLCGSGAILEAGAGAPFGEVLCPSRYTRHLASEKEMREKFRTHPQAVEAASAIAELCEFTLEDVRTNPIARLPLHDFVRGQDAYSYLWDKVFDAATMRYGPITDKIKDRLNEEFDSVKRRGFAHYIVFLQYLAEYLKKEKIPFIFRHESLNSSLIAHLISLNELDPIKYHVKFKALTQEDENHPAAQMEIPNDFIDSVVRHLREMFSPSSICEVGHFQPWPRASLLHFIAQWARLSSKDFEYFQKSTSDKKTLKKEEYQKFIAEKRSSLPISDPDFLFAIFSRLYPRPRFLQPKRGILAFCSKELESVIPCRKNEDTFISEFEEEFIDQLGMHSIRISPNMTLDILKTAVDWVRKQGNPRFSLNSADLADAPTYERIGLGFTEGIPPFESITFKSLLRKNRPASFLELVKTLLESGQPASAKAASNKSPSISSLLSLCLMGFRCAYIKTHHPVSFLTAALTHFYKKNNNMENYISLVRQTKRLGIKILPPSINDSLWDFSQEGENIRSGLMIVRQVGERAGKNIFNARPSGSFDSLADICQRTDNRVVNYRVLENLIKAGALDSFGLRRSQLLHILENTITFFKKEKEEVNATLTLFGEEDIERLSEAPDIPEFTTDELMQMERETAGYVITRYPLEPFTSLLKDMHTISRGDLTAKHSGMEKFIGGFIDYIEEEGPFITGDTVMLLDFESILIKVGKETAERYKSALKLNLPILIGGVVEKLGEFPALSANCAFVLEDLAEKIKSLRKIVINCAGPPAISYDTLRRIHRLIKEFPGETALEILNVPEGGGGLARKIAKLKVLFCPPLYYELTRLLPAQSIRPYTAAPTADDAILAGW